MEKLKKAIILKKQNKNKSAILYLLVVGKPIEEAQMPHPFLKNLINEVNKYEMAN